MWHMAPVSRVISNPDSLDVHVGLHSAVRMSLLSRQGRISIKPFASVPSLANLLSIQRAQASVSGVSSRSGFEDFVDLSL